MRKVARFPLPFVAVAAAIAFAAPCAARFAPDAHTLFLAHFDGQLERADCAQGMSLFAGNGARPVAGYYGAGIDLRPRGLTGDFMRTCGDYSPRFDGWGFHARGNLDPAQGTFECWVQPADPKRPGAKWPGGLFLNADLQRCVPHPDGSKNMYASFSVSLSTYKLAWCLPTLKGNCFLGEVVFSEVPGYQRKLAVDWHHFALAWSQGEMLIWLDGRPLASFDMTGQLGLVALDNPVRYLSMSGCLLDELRISSAVRYREPFEPGWRNGGRPATAFPGVPGVPRYEPRLLLVPAPAVSKLGTPPETLEERVGEYLLRFDRATGALAGWGKPGRSAEGLILHEGLQRRPLAPRALKEFRRADGALRFTQEFEGQIEAAQRLAACGKSLLWEIVLTNRGTREAWLEPVLGVECPLPAVDEFFDGCEPRRSLEWPRHRDEYFLTLPFAAASGGKRCFGIGTDPHIDLNDVITEWVPLPGGGVIRQGTKLALNPGESFTLPFRIVSGESDFGTLDAIEAFHEGFPDLYRLRPDVPVYSYMPATQDLPVDNAADLKRVGFAGSYWGHGPGHDKGDEFGRAEWWDNPGLYGRREYAGYTRRIERIWGSLEGLRENITYRYRRDYDNGYPVRRFHTCPDLTPEYILQSLWPGYRPNEDPLCFGQYYVPITNWWLVNEHNTPIGSFFRETTRNYHRQAAGYCVGFINDMSHAGALYRHNDEAARRAPGRSFSRDLGAFVRQAAGRKQRYEVLNSFVDAGQRASFWSDGGAFSYTLCAYSAAIAIEGGAMYRDLTGPAEYVVAARNLLGEKPLTAMTHLNDDWIGTFLAPEEFSPASLRDYYRFCDSQLTLFCLRYGVTLDPTSYMCGRQVSLERAPLLAESSVLGRKLVPAARVRDPLWVCRSGEGLRTLVMAGNPQPAAMDTRLELVNRYFPGAPILAPYYGGQAEHSISLETTTLEGLRILPRDLAAFKAVALLTPAAPARVTSRLDGDGLTLCLALDIAAPPGTAITVSGFGPLYDVTGLRLDGADVVWRAGDPLRLPGAKHRLEVSYANRALAFAASDWAAVELVKEGRPNFCLAADPGIDYAIPSGKSSQTYPIGFERGTAALLNDFLAQYDEEDGVPRNLAPAAFVTQRPQGFAGWLVRLAERRELAAGRVRIDVPAREIVVEGPTQGEMRRAMLVWMRLVDRKYPHVGRFFPFNLPGARYEPGKPLPLEKWVDRKATREFFQAFADPDFLTKPVLGPEYEPLYANGNRDFAGHYRLRVSPYLLEPAYGDEFVCGYSGPGTATPRQELLRQATEPAEPSGAKK